MDKINSVFDVAARAMSAQMTRLNTVASNLANANAVASSKEEAFQALRPVFATQYAQKINKSGLAAVGVDTIVALDREPGTVFAPDHPKANADGYIYRAAVDTDEEMVEMLEASRQYQNNLEVLSTLRSLMMRTVNMGR
jgi:flagellar basal-body rod protein FlgC